MSEEFPLTELPSDMCETDSVAALTALYPPAGLVIHTPRLILRTPESDAVIERLADAAADGIHEPGWQPFSVDWSNGTREEVRRAVASNVWRVRSEPLGYPQVDHPSSWELLFAVRLRDSPEEPFGQVKLFADRYPALRTVSTGSWFTRSAQGHGYGTEARKALLSLAFDGLGAHRAESVAMHDNIASQTVSLRCGYRFTHSYMTVRERKVRRYVLTREDWAAREQRMDVTWEGLDPVLSLIGVADLD